MLNAKGSWRITSGNAAIRKNETTIAKALTKVVTPTINEDDFEFSLELTGYNRWITNIIA